MEVIEYKTKDELKEKLLNSLGNSVLGALITVSSFYWLLDWVLRTPYLCYVVYSYELNIWSVIDSVPLKDIEAQKGQECIFKIKKVD